VTSESKNNFSAVLKFLFTILISVAITLGVLFLAKDYILDKFKSNEPAKLTHSIPKPVDSGSLHVTTEPDGAEIFLDNQSMGYAPVELKQIDPGPHTLVAKKEYYLDMEKRFVIKKDQVIKENLQMMLEQIAPSTPVITEQPVAEPQEPPPPQLGSLLIKTEPAKAEIILDGKSLGTAPVEIKEIEVGSYPLTVRKKYYQVKKQDIVIEKDVTLKKTIKLTRGKGIIRVLTTPDKVQVYLDGKEQPDTTPMTIKNVSAGKHKLRFGEGVYHRSSEKEVEVLPGKTASVKRTLKQYGRLYINTTQENVAIDLPDGDAEYSPGMMMTPGKYKVTATAPKFQAIEQIAVISEGQDYKLDIELIPLWGNLYVETKPADAVIKLLNLEKEFEQGMELAEGKYQIRVERPGFTPASKWFTVKAGQKIQVKMTLDPPLQFKNGLGMTFKWIRPGTFVMGSQSDEPGRDEDETLHKVTLKDGFYMQTTEVTQLQWKKVMGNNPSYFSDCGDHCPVENISWNDAKKFISELNFRSKKKYSLPTESEWEYACRAGSRSAIYTGDLQILGENDGPKLDPIAWYGGNSRADYYGASDCSDWKDKQMPGSLCGIHPVAQKKPNAWGLYDMLGNVWEWCADWYGTYPSGHVTDPRGPSSGEHRIIRGGSWLSSVVQCRSSFHGRANPSAPSYGVGFRIVLRMSPENN